jgi:Fe-S-cluster containining protein
MSSALDCTTCGACCTNPDENVAENYPWYLEVRDTPLLDERSRAHANLAKKHVVYDPDGVPHLRLDPSGRCTALVGKIGARVRCTIYELRPKGCRMLMPGDERCLQARKERGIDR